MYVVLAVHVVLVFELCTVQKVAILDSTIVPLRVWSFLLVSIGVCRDLIDTVPVYICTFLGREEKRRRVSYKFLVLDRYFFYGDSLQICELVDSSTSFPVFLDIFVLYSQKKISLAHLYCMY